MKPTSVPQVFFIHDQGEKRKDYVQRPKDLVGTFLSLGTGKVDMETTGINMTSGSVAERLEHGLNLFKTLINQVCFCERFKGNLYAIDVRVRRPTGDKREKSGRAQPQRAVLSILSCPKRGSGPRHH